MAQMCGINVSYSKLLHVLLLSITPQLGQECKLDSVLFNSLAVFVLNLKLP